MIYEILIGLAFGFSVCIPIGPINILILNYSVNAIKIALIIGFGAASSDSFYMLLFGILATKLPPIFNDILGLCGFCILSYMSFSLFKAKTKNTHIHPGQLSKSDLGKYFIKGYLLNALNPYVIAFWMGVAPNFANSAYPSAYAISICSACFIWVVLLSFVVSKFAAYLSAKVLRVINVLSSIVLFVFALNMLKDVSFVAKFF